MKLFPLVVTIFALTLITGCGTKRSSFDNQIVNRGSEATQTADDLQRGEKLIARGNSEIQSGQSKVSQGQALIAQARADFCQRTAYQSAECR